jgi:hypothetical protein
VLINTVIGNTIDGMMRIMIGISIDEKTKEVLNEHKEITGVPLSQMLERAFLEKVEAGGFK